MARPSLRRWFPRAFRLRSTAPVRHPLSVTQLEDRVTPANFVVSTLLDGGAGSLRQAILDANAAAGPDTVSFAVAGTITPASALPTLTGGGTTIDGTTAPGYAGAPVVTIQGPTGGAGLKLNSANNVVRGLQIVGYTSFGGVEVFGAAATGNVIEGNYLGHDGTTARPNTYGVYVYGGASGTRIGTDADGVNDAAERNVISGNSSAGIELAGGSTNTTVRGNYIGTTPGGSAAIANFVGVEVSGSTFNTIGGTAAGAGNLISGSKNDGVRLVNANDNVIQGNLVGTTAAGTAGLGNGIGSNGFGNGIEITFSSRNTVGGTAAGAGNVVAANGGDGVLIQADSSNPNANKAELNVVQGNRVGTDVTGMVGLGNSGYGVTIWPGSNNTIGGSAAGAGNVISANLFSGVNVTGVPTTVIGTGNVVQGNLIGVAADGTTALGNREHGVIVGYTSNTTIRGNTIAYNGVSTNSSSGVGVAVSNAATTGAAILGNAIHSNLNVGIDLNFNGVTSNDTGDGDTGPNGLQNFPVITSGASSGGTTTIGGTLNSTANATFTLEFFASAARDPSLFGEGERFLGSTTVTTNATGNATFTAVLPVTVAGGQWLTATATSAANSTSEFAQAFKINQAPTPGNDAITVTEDGFINFLAKSNDTDPDGDALTLVSVTSGSFGVTSINIANQTIKYTPNANYSGGDSFTYTVSDGRGGTATATVTVTVTPVNDAPVAGPLVPGPALAADQALSTAASTATPANLAYDGARYLSVWSQGSDVYGRFIDRNGTPPGSPFLIAGLANNQTEPVVAFNGTYFLVAWYDNAGSTGGDSINARLVSTSGQVLGSELVLASASNSRFAPAVASDGTDFLVVWTDNRNFATNFSDVMGQRVTASAAGAALAGANFLVSPAGQTQFQPSVAYGAGTYFVAWTNDVTSNGGQRDVYGTLVSSAGVASAPFAVSTAANGQQQPNVAFGGGNFLVTFDDLRFNGNRDDVYAVRVSPAGALLDGDGATGGVAVSTNAGLGSPHAPKAVFNGTDWFVVWGGTRAVGARVRADGTLADAAPINLFKTATSQWFPAVAFDGTNCYVTWAVDTSNYAKFGQLVGSVPTDQLVTTAEDAAAVVTLSATDVDGDALTYTVVTAPAHGTLSGTAPNLVFTPAANYNGTDTFTYKANDGQADSNVVTVRVTITAVNDAPAFDPIVDRSVNEDAAAQAVTITGVGPGGGADESGQAVTFTATSSDPAVIPNPTVTGTGATRTLTFQPAANANGVVTITVTATDGQAANNTFTRTFTVTVNPVNDAPSFTRGANQAVAEDAGPQSLANWATGVSAGPANESGQVLQFQVTGNTNAALFSVAPAVAADGTLTYTPAPDANGSATITLRLADNGGTANGGTDTSAAQTFTITVAAVNDAPVARDDTATTDEDNAVTVDVLANDSAGPVTATDEAGQTLTIVSVTQPAHGTVTINANNTVTYTPDANYNGPDSFSYTARDNGVPNAEATATGTITINPVNDAPTAAAGAVTTAEDSAGVSIDLRPLAADVETADADLTYTIVTGPPSGTLAATGTAGVYTYTPAANVTGSVAFTYTVTDTGEPLGTDVRTSAAATVTITITPVNDAPTATGDSYGANEDTLLSAAAPGVLGNDADVDGDLIHAVLVSGPAHGVLNLNADGSFTYAPAADFHGADSFTYKANDGAADSNTVTVSLTVNAVNDAPVAAAEGATTDEDAAVTVAVLANDSDADGDALAVTAVTQGAHGGVVVNGDNTVTYTPAADYFGSDTFTYTVSDGHGGAATATVTVTVNPVNDAPTAAPDAATTAEDTPATIAVRGNDTDVEGDALTVTGVTQGAHGSVTVNGGATVTYTPAADFHGTDTFTYTVSDGNGGTATAAVTVTVTSVNDAPVAADDAATTAEDAAVTVAVLANDADVDGDALAVSAVTQGDHGTVTFTTSSVTYTPAADYHGADSFTYTASDGNGGTATATVLVTVTAVNDAPVAAGQAVTTNEDTPVNGTVTATDADGDARTFAVVAGPAHGVLTSFDGTTGAFTYVPAADYHGPDSFTFRADDGTADSNTATVALTVAPVNDTPAAAADAYTTAEDTPLTVAAPGVLANDADADGDALTAVLVAGPAHGTLTLSPNGSFTYIPAANYHGPDSFTYRASDGAATSGTVTVALSVAAVNDAPVAVGNAYTTSEGTTLAVAAPGVLQNDSDADGDGLSAVLVTGPAHGTLTLNANGSFSYTPAAGFSGNDTFTYRASDGQATSNVATVTITVNATGAGATLVADPCDPALTALVVRGTAGGDTITLTPSGTSGAVVVKLNGAALGTYSPTGRVIVYGMDGDDDLQTAGSVSRPVWLHGGAGDDRLKGGDGHDVLLGEDGDDLLVGNGGRDLLVGGEGADRIVGNAEDDILIAGFTDHDGDDHALCAVMDEWTSARSFADRVANLKGGPGAGADRANGTTYLNPATTHDDGREDVLTGSSGVDWYLFNEDGDGGVADRVTDMSTFEALFAADIDFIYVDPI